jgi:phosphoribosyl 1,2-cyclic phosphodiesterase
VNLGRLPSLPILTYGREDIEDMRIFQCFGRVRHVRGNCYHFAAARFEVMPGLALTPLRLAHDELGSHGFVIEGGGCRLGYATDLGRVPDRLLEHFRDLDVLALESNYDRQMELNSARPFFLKKRIMGGAGHLSNEQAFEAVRRILDDHQARGGRLPRHIVLLHRSRECNCPKLLRRYFEQDARIAPRLTLAEQFERTQWLKIRPRGPLVGEQLSLAW